MSEPCRLRTWREQRGLSLPETSGLTGLSVPYLSRIERDQRTPPPMVKVEIARRLGATVEELFPPAPLSVAVPA